MHYISDFTTWALIITLTGEVSILGYHNSLAKALLLDSYFHTKLTTLVGGCLVAIDIDHNTLNRAAIIIYDNTSIEAKAIIALKR